MAKQVATRTVESPSKSPRVRKEEINKVRHKFEKFRLAKSKTHVVIDESPTQTVKAKVENEAKFIRKIKPELDYK